MRKRIVESSRSSSSKVLRGVGERNGGEGEERTMNGS